MVMAGERTKDAANRNCVRFWVDDGMVRESREGGHPAYTREGWEPWEILACLKDIANFLNVDPNCQRKALRG